MRFVPESALIDRITAIAEPVCAACGVDCYLVEVLGGNRPSVVRVYIDAIGGVTIDDCTKVSRQLSAALDVEDPIHGRYALEVSSPGLERVLRDLEDVKAVIGQNVKIETHAPVEGRRRFAGPLVGVEGEDLVVKIDQQNYRIPAVAIRKAQLQPVFDQSNTTKE